jgi:hypothetical protein
VWIADSFDYLGSQSTLGTLAPDWTATTTPPLPDWIVGTDYIVFRFATPVAAVAAGTNVTVTHTVSGNQNTYVINVPSVPPSDISPGTMPPGVGVPPGNLTPGTIPTTTILPVGNLTGPGTIDPVLLPVGPECLSGAIDYTTTDTETLVLSLDAPFGLIGGWNLVTGANQVHVYFKYVNANGDFSDHTAAFFGATSWWGVPIMDFMGASGTDTPLHGPYVHFELRLKSAFGGSPSDCHIYYSAIAC